MIVLVGNTALAGEFPVVCFFVTGGDLPRFIAREQPDGHRSSHGSGGWT
jgi:hypothetical protein